MRKETNEALNAIVKDLTELPGGTDVQISMHAMELISAITGTEKPPSVVFVRTAS